MPFERHMCIALITALSVGFQAFMTKAPDRVRWDSKSETLSDSNCSVTLLMLSVEWLIPSLD